MVVSRPRFPRSLLPRLRTVHRFGRKCHVELDRAAQCSTAPNTRALFRPRTAAGYFDPNTMLLLSPLPRPCLICRLSGGQFQASASELGLWPDCGKLLAAARHWPLLNERLGAGGHQDTGQQYMVIQHF